MSDARQKRKRVTIKDIAAQCGLSVCAVSAVLQNRQKERRISDESVSKIRAAMLELGYMPNLGARRLCRGLALKTPLVIAVLSTYEAPLNPITGFLFEMSNAVENCPEIRDRFDVSIVFELYNAGKISEKKSIISGDNFNAAIIANTTREDDDFLSSTKLPYPCVLAGRRVDGYFSVVDDSKHGQMAAKCLKDAGCKRFGIMYGKPLTQLTRTRIEGFLTGVDSEIVTMINASNLSAKSGYEAMLNFIKGGQKIDALFTVTDSLAEGAYKAIKESGLRIPKDISVLGIGDNSNPEFFDPPLSTVGASSKEFAKKCCDLLLKQITGKIRSVEVVNLEIKESKRESIK